MSARLAVLLLASACAAEPEVDWRDRVIYQIVTDRFANGDPTNDDLDGISVVPGDLTRAQGGDFRGITERLDYVAALGANAIWISPIVANVPRNEVGDGYHGYWARDFVTLNPRLGNEADLDALVSAAHARDIAVIVDIVPNHTGRVFEYDVDGDGAGDPDPAGSPRYAPTRQPGEVLFSFEPRLWTGEGDATLTLGADHFHRRGIGNLGVPEERRYGDFPEGLRDLNTERPEVATALAATFARWAIRYDLDGYRVDAVPHVDRAFWPVFCTELRARLAQAGKHGFYLLGEVFEIDARRLTPWLEEGSIDGAFDVPLQAALIDGVILGGGPPSSARGALETDRPSYRATPQPGGVGLSGWEARVAFGDSHDVVRMRAALDDPFAVDQALVAIFTVDAIPLVYYGTEQELAGGSGHAGREPLWETGYAEDGPTFALIQRLARIRRASLALRRGVLRIRFASEIGGSALGTTEPDAAVLAWERSHGDEHVLVVLNTHPVHTATTRLATSLPDGTAIDYLGGERLEVVAGMVTVTLPPRTSVIVGR